MRTRPETHAPRVPLPQERAHEALEAQRQAEVQYEAARRRAAEERAERAEARRHAAEQEAAHAAEEAATHAAAAESAAQAAAHDRREAERAKLVADATRAADEALVRVARAREHQLQLLHVQQQQLLLLQEQAAAQVQATPTVQVQAAAASSAQSMPDASVAAQVTVDETHGETAEKGEALGAEALAARRQARKTIACKWWKQGICRLGEKCALHPLAPDPPRSPLV